MLCSDKDIANLQGKLYGEMSKIEGLGNEEIYNATSMLASKHDLIRVFFTFPDHVKKGYIIQMMHHKVQYDINYDVETMYLCCYFGFN